SIPPAASTSTGKLSRNFSTLNVPFESTCSTTGGMLGGFEEGNFGFDRRVATASITPPPAARRRAHREADREPSPLRRRLPCTLGIGCRHRRGRRPLLGGS